MLGFEKGLVGLEILNKLVNLLKFARNTDVLRAMGLALSTLQAMVGLAQAWNGTVETNEILASQLHVLRIHDVGGQRALVLAFIVMDENAWDV